ITAWLAEASWATRIGCQIGNNAPKVVIARSAPAHGKGAGRHVGIELILLVNSACDYMKVVSCPYSRQGNTDLHNAMTVSADGRVGAYRCHVDHGKSGLSLSKCCKRGTGIRS